MTRVEQRRVVLVLALACVAGCATERNDSLDETGADTSPWCEVPYGAFSCEMDVVCDVSVINNCSPPAVPAEGDPACVISRLRGDSPARVQIGTSQDPNALFCGWRDDVYIIGDGTAIMRRTMPGSSQGANVKRVEIRAPEFFDVCAQSDDPVVLNECLSDWFVTNSCVGGVCCPVPGDGEGVECAE